MSDRKLDAWIAENVTDPYPGYTLIESPLWEGYCYIDDEDSPIYRLPEYTSDMNEAVEELRKLQLKYEDAIFHLWHDCAWFFEELDYDGKITQIVHDDDPAKAICLAAYKLRTGKDWLNE